MTTAQQTANDYETYLSDCGFDDTEIALKLVERELTRLRMQEKSKHVAQPRNITCLTYEAAQKRLFSSVSAFVSGKAGAA